MAEYLTYAYESQTDPVAARATLSAWKSFSRGAAYFPVPLEKPALFEYYGDVYGPGPMVLFRQLEVLSSQDKVLAGLATLLGAERAISVDDVIAALESSTGIDLEDYASAWIRGTGAPVWPTVSVTYEPGPETSTVSVRITNGAERRCKFHVGLRGEAPEDAVDVAVDTLRDGTEQTLTIPTPAFDVTTTVVDPHAECLVYPGIATRTERRHPWRSDRGLAHDRAAP
jgi:aminopeptidase N